MEKTKSVQVRPFGMRDKIGYALGDFGNDFTFLLASALLLKFYTDVMGVGAGIVGTLMMVARFIDAFTDVTMGQIVDRSKPGARGKFIPWMRRFMGPVALASLLMYATWFKDMPMAFKVVWLIVTYILWGSVCYTGVNIPYGSMASAITDDPHDRTKLSTWRNVGATVAGMIINVALPIFCYYTNENGNEVLSGSRVTIAAVFCSIGAVICYVLCTSMVTERVKIEQKTEKFELKKLLKQLFSSRSLISIIVAAILLLLCQLTMMSMAQYFFPSYFNSSLGISISGGVGCIVMVLLALCVIPPMSKRLGKKETAIIGNIVSAVAYLFLYVIHTENMAVFIVFNSLGYIGLGMFNGVIWALIVDVINEDEIRRGTRSDGTIYSLYSFARKLGQALSAGISGWLLAFIGYSTTTMFEPEVASSLYIISTLIPAIGFVLLVIVLLFWYPLGKKQVDEINAELAKRKG